MNASSTWAWAVEEFGGAELGHIGRTRRLVRVAAAFASARTGVVTEAVTEKTERQGAYRLFENEEVKPDGVGEPMFAATVARCVGQECVFVPVDGSSLNAADPLGVRGTGPIGARNKGGRGFLVQSALAVRSDGVPLGLCGQVWWTRSEQRVSRTASKRKPKDKETRYWLDVIASVRARFLGSGCTPWYQLDRGGDAWPVLKDFVAHGERATVRASYDRRLAGPAGGERRYLWAEVERTAPVGRYDIEVPGGPKRKARRARMTVRAAEVTLALRNHQTKTRYPTPIWAVLAREDNPPPGERAIEWMLLTTHVCPTMAAAAEVLWGYVQRWRIEEFHKAWKTGACNVEDTQLHEERGIHVLALVLAAVATRLLRLAYLSRASPNTPASEEFSSVEITAILRLKKRRRPKGTVTLAMATTWLAELGGYTGKQSGGPPGFTTLSRGLRRLRDAVAILLPDEEIGEPQ